MRMVTSIFAQQRTLFEMRNARSNVKRDLVHGEGENVFPKKETLTVEREPEVTKGHAILEQMILAWMKTRSEQLVVLFPHVLQVIYFLLTQNTKTIKAQSVINFLLTFKSFDLEKPRRENKSQRISSTPRPLKVLGKWKLDGDCIPTTLGSNCGPGTQIRTRTCKDGAIQKCEFRDRISRRQCKLKDCPKVLGEWNDVEECRTFDTSRKCGKGKRLQTRSCKDGTIDICNSEETSRNVNCITECRKEFGPWLEGRCVLDRRNANCGEGKRRDTRKCDPGTNEPCVRNEMTRTITCNINCPKLFGEWEYVEECKPLNTLRKCGAGKRLQRRSCNDGTIDICSSEETIRDEDCTVGCRKRLGPWLEGRCISDQRNSNCGRGKRRDTRKCDPGTNDPCRRTEMTRTITCNLTPCTTGKIFPLWNKI